MKRKVNTEYLNSVKNAVDFIYEVTKESYDGSFSSLKNSTVMRVSAEMIKRGVLEKTRHGKSYSYLWTAQSAPTTNFYLSIAQSLQEHKRLIDKAYRLGKKQNAPRADQTPAVEEISNVVDFAPTDLKSASIQELWDELKSRGVIIENGRLVMKTYLD